MSTATKATNESIEQLPQQQVAEELGRACGRARVWYRAHGRPAEARVITQFLKDFVAALYTGTVADDDPKARAN
jgi:hypothetical protein